MNNVNCFIPYSSGCNMDKLIDRLSGEEHINQIYLLGPEPASGEVHEQVHARYTACTVIECESIYAF